MIRKTILFLVFFVLIYLVGFLEVRRSLLVEVELVAPVSEGVAVFYLSENSNVTEKSKKVEFMYAGVLNHTFRIDLNFNEDYQFVRFDPVWGEGEVVLKSIRLSRFGSNDIDLHSVSLVHGEVEFAFSNSGLTLVSRGDDPYVFLVSNLDELSPDSVLGLFLYVFFVSVAAALFAKIFSRRYSLAIKASLDRVRFRQLLVDVSKGKISVNLLVLVVSVILVGLSAYISLGKIGGHLSSFYFVSMFSYALRVFILASIAYLIFTTRFFRFKFLGHILSASLLAFSLFLCFNSVLMSMNGMSLYRGLNLLFHGGVSQILKNMGFTGLSSGVLGLYVALIVLGCFVFFLFVFLAERFHENRPCFISRRRLVLFVVSALGFVFLEQAFSSQYKSSRLLAKEQSSLIGYVPVFPVKEYLFRYPVDQNSIQRKDILADSAKASDYPKSTPVFLFIIESLRDDVLDKSITPSLFEFKSDSLSFSRAIASGNASHYGWFSIVNGWYPYFWEHVINQSDSPGSPALNIFQKNGYKVNVFSSKDLSYLSGLKYMAGTQGARFDSYLSRPKMSVPDLDNYVIEKFGGYVEGIDQSDRSVNIVFMDSLHFPYRWSDSIEGLDEEFSGSPDGGIGVAEAANLMVANPKLLLNRYRNSVRFTDYTFSNFIDHLKRSGLYDSSIIAVVSDHGQQFMEHGYLMHGATLFPEDIYIPMYIKFPDGSVAVEARMAAQVDIMPTVLDYLGMYEGNESLFDGQSLLRQDNRKSVLSAVAGLENTPYRFSLETTKYKLDFELDRKNTHESEYIYIVNIRDQADADFIPGTGSLEDYISFVNAEFRPHLANLSFVREIGDADSF